MLGQWIFTRSLGPDRCLAIFCFGISSLEKVLEGGVAREGGGIEEITAGGGTVYVELGPYLCLQ